VTANVHAPDRINPRGWRLRLRFAVGLRRFVPHAKHGDQANARADDHQNGEKDQNRTHGFNRTMRFAGCLDPLERLSQPDALVPEGAIWDKCAILISDEHWAFGGAKQHAQPA
jgi:hypothetical protein